MKKLIIAALLIPSVAYAGGIDGVYSNLPEACEWNKNQTDVYPESFELITYLSKDGINGWEWGCDFLSSYEKNGIQVYVAACSVEGTPWPDLVMVEKLDNGYSVTMGNNMSETPMEFTTKCE